MEMDDPKDDDDGNDDDEGDLGDDFKEAIDKEQQQNGVSAAGETQNSVGGLGTQQHGGGAEGQQQALTTQFVPGVIFLTSGTKVDCGS